MNRTSLAALSLALMVTPAPGASAHHPFSAVYAMDRQITIEGDVVQLVVRRPHSYVHVAVQAGATIHRWAVEWESRDDGRGPDGPMQVLHVGDHVLVTGYGGRDPATFRLLARTVSRPSDGWQWTGTND